MERFLWQSLRLNLEALRLRATLTVIITMLAEACFMLHVNAEGQRIHYNFVKPHQALEGMTPAQRAGISQKKATWNQLLMETFSKN